MKKHLMIDWRGEDTTVVLENVTALEVAAKKYEDVSKACGN